MNQLLFKSECASKAVGYDLMQHITQKGQKSYFPHSTAYRHRWPLKYRKQLKLTGICNGKD
ncbi:MAG: hypothetical protein DRQ88_11285 [Epsilonproteobacteria bacterium]|nr:MAG: hypothetical protein DRQ89_06640 [Campylobacterota bacterium]RLA64266.1 MAG: hypothetical protein DRQ88_11285 [Campylobacterota bacterium]